MFSSIGRKLAILNAAVVLGILALVSLTMFIYLQRSLRHEVDEALEDRSAAAQVEWASLFEAPASAGIERVSSKFSDRSDRGDEDETDAQEESRKAEEEAAEDFVKSGDTIGFALNVEGDILAASRGITIRGLPYRDDLPEALAGESVYSDITIDGRRVRVLTEPVIMGGVTAGFVQVAQGQGAFESALRTVRLATVGSVLLGALVAIPAGLFLAQRSMRPIRRAFEQQRAFVADASHELRTPLTVMRAQAEFLQRSSDGLSAAELDHGHDVIIGEVDAMSRLVDDLLLLARAEQAKLTLETEDHDLTQTISDAVRLFVLRADHAGIALTFESDGLLRATFDATRVQQVVRILLDNALTHTPQGGKVSVRLSRRVNSALVVVSDTGSGIAPNDLPFVFDRFYRARGKQQSSGGLGLGLAIARTLVEAHGGVISVESSPEKPGTTFLFTLPL